MEIIILIDVYLRAVHSRSISGKMGGNALKSSQAEQSGSSKGHLRLLHYGSEMSRLIYVRWIDGLEVEVILSWETAMFIYQGRWWPVSAKPSSGCCDPMFINYNVDLQQL